MDRATLNRFADLVTPHVPTVEKQQELVMAAFSGTPLTNQIQYGGAARTFAIMLISSADRFGEIEAGFPAVCALLDVVRGQVGLADQQAIDALKADLGCPGGVPDAPPPKLFISYKTAASVDFAGRLHDRLEVMRPHWQVFLDRSDMKAGRWPDQLREGVRGCDVFLPVIGTETFATIGNPDDWVRQEILMALAEDKPIVPVLQGTAGFPNDLPDEIKPISDFQAVPVYSNQFNSGVDLLIEKIESVL